MDLIIAALLMGFLLGFYVHMKLSRMLYDHLLEMAIKEADLSTDLITVRCAVEQHSGQYFLYRLPDWHFLAQASNLEDCKTVVEKNLGKQCQIIFVDLKNETSSSQ